MANPPQRLPTEDTRDDDAMHPTNKPAPATTDAEPSLLPHAARKFDVQHIPVDKVSDVGNREHVNDETVTVLAESIERIGLLTPIMVRLQENVPDLETAEVPDAAYILIAGRHRLEAYRKLGLRHIPAIVRDCSELEAELRMFAEKAADSPEEA